MKYSQPDFYHFSQDSTLLAKYVSQCNWISEVESILDIFSGSGVIGIELLLRLGVTKKISFCEVQKEYKEHFYKNIEMLDQEQIESLDVSWESYQEFFKDQKFDLILANPPYFKKGHGRKSPNHNKQLCRSFELGDIEDFLSRAFNCLSEKGRVVLVLRDIPNKLKEYNILFEGSGYLIVEVVSLNVN